MRGGGIFFFFFLTKPDALEMKVESEVKTDLIRADEAAGWIINSL